MNVVLPHPEMLPSVPGIASPECSPGRTSLSTDGGPRAAFLFDLWACSWALTVTDPLSLIGAEPADARVLVNERGGTWCGDGSRRAPALVSFFVWQEGRFFVPAYDSDRDARSVGQGRSGATRSHAQRPIASMARIASTGP